MGLLRGLRRLLAGAVRCLPFSEDVKRFLKKVTNHIKSLNPIQLHDLINLVSIGALNVLNFTHLWCGKGFKVLISACYSYFIADIGYIAAFPASAKNAVVIIAHHIITAAYLTVPLILPRFRKLMSLCLLVEINTWLQIARKTFRHRIVEASFYATWIGIRLLYFPYLIPTFASLYLESADSAGNKNPLLLMACAFQSMLTGLNYFWTVELLVKVTGRRKRAAVTSKANLDSKQGRTEVVNVSAEPQRE